ncbi:hypothetical protein FGADI_12065 [Fusarium gaditjirri]|uniref:Cyclic nucleotide-binding domain-containing protein n=1 Tax=Fusarium gaditjirri TaxID=282569 RepID=A0A8H4ST07_9HYPO|nr:hypothetical protein FGADI_12065 [Fusarium gaditjirri]
MSEQEERCDANVMFRPRNWSKEDALRALDAEFWCRNEANYEKTFNPGESTIREGDPGYEFWLQLRAKIHLYFEAAAAFPDCKGDRHPMTRETIEKALAAVRAFYGDKHVLVDGERVHWEQTLPDKADWIVDRFCSPFNGWNSLLAQAASILGLISWLDIMDPVDWTETSVEGDDVPVQEEDEDNASIKDDDTPMKGNDTSAKNYETLLYVMAEFDNKQRQQRDEFDELQSKVEHLNKERETQQTSLEGLKNDYHRLKEKSDEQFKEVEQLRSTVAGLEAEVGKLRKHSDEQEKLHKKHLEEVLELSSMSKTSMEDQNLDGAATIDSDGVTSSRFEIPDPGPSSSLDHRRVWLKRNAPETSLSGTSNPMRRKFITGTPKSSATIRPNQNLFGSDGRSRTDTRR